MEKIFFLKLILLKIIFIYARSMIAGEVYKYF